MTDEELTDAIRVAYEGLRQAIKAAEEGGLTVRADFVDRHQETGSWALRLEVARVTRLAETDGHHWRN